MSDIGTLGLQISVVIPAHNQAQLLNAAIASILESPLVLEPEQVIVVDDDSRDQTEQVARDHHVRYLRVEYHNVSRSRNAGLALVETPYLAFLDHDDAWLSGNMQPHLAALEAHPTAAFAYGIARCATWELEALPWTFPSPPLPSGHVPDQLHLVYPNLGVVLFRREPILDVGGFDPRIAYHQDADLMIRIAAGHEIVGVEFVGMLHRLRDPSKSRADYYWRHHRVTNWTPRGVGVGWRTAVTLRFRMRGLFYRRFCEDAAACAAAGRRRDALECLARALWVSPEHGVRHFRTVWSTFIDSVRAAPAPDRRALVTR